jgi:arylsulfatase A-like enzyme
MSSKDTSKPNIVFILSDDQGSWAMGCAGNYEIRTPNLDLLAAQGMRFENFFCTSPVCSPARASLLTGRIPSQHGVHDWIRKGSAGEFGERPIEYLAGQLSYTEILAANGYNCGISGKWHLGYSIKPQKGFSHWYVHQLGGSEYYGAPMIKDGEMIRETRYITDVITDDALDFINERKKDNEPFYLSVHYTAPHHPWIDNHPKEIVALYDDCPFETCPQRDIHPWMNYNEEFMKNVNENLKGYFAAVTAMDINIGRIIDSLKAAGLRDNTLICFMSDNGFNCGHHGIWGKGNGTFPLNMYDSSVKVPAIFSHPQRIPEGVICDELLSGYDFMPTLLDYVGLKNPEADKLPGRSFLPVLLGLNAKSRENVVIYDEYGPVRMVRSKEWKYVHRYPYGPNELYDLVNDPGEYYNLIADESKRDVIFEMKAQMEDWFVQYVDPILDGRHEPVTGAGQDNMAGPKGFGAYDFNQTD